MIDQIKIGRFIATCRKNKNITQSMLAERLSITDRAISKWENGRGMPDSSIMLDLCKELGISVNELLSGEMIDMNDNEIKMNENLLEFKRRDEEKNKRLVKLEIALGIVTTLSFVTLFLVGIFAMEEGIAQMVVITLGSLQFIIGISLALYIENEAGYFECQKCKHRYVPEFKKMYWAPHVGTIRYMTCPKCHQKSWQKKVLTKDN